MFFKTFHKNILVLLIPILFLLSGCTLTRNVVPQTSSPEQAYKLGMEMVENKQFKLAAQVFENLYIEHCTNKLAPEAMIMEAYCMFKARRYLDTEDIISEFLDLYPHNKDVNYALYLKLLAYIKQLGPSACCIAKAQDAISVCNTLLSTFPECEYSEKVSKEHLPFLNKYVLEKDMIIGRFYLKKRNVPGAILRFRKVLNQSKDNIFIQEALLRMVEAHLMLGLKEEAKEFQSELGNKFHNSTWNNASLNIMQKYLKNSSKNPQKKYLSKNKTKSSSKKQLK
ncbi:outer membrane protein assembly factor BamD [Candidatus Sneabacter namystus]|uniref:Outer membrane protein assembly factor BamD n=1 Tax=Candidatus Sneabacter namystus TaxID=2601646 RepID=A0A5C0UHR7_9RICK|nr:outer membrane protein assembly factor BamD [Candidatus Sneabacter namystus]QEK39725.1 outer membrane protein assembly factor BamD [Candidatus Sneabacter namystus]